MPDRVLIFENSRVGAVSYSEIRFVIDTTRFIEEETVPRDASVVDRTWRFVNKNGSPDRRFNNNNELPVCLYEVLNLNSDSGFNEVIHISRIGISASLQASMNSLASAINASLAAEANRQQVDEKSEILNETSYETGTAVETTILSTPPPIESVETGLLYVLCCVMVADGTASRSERIYIHKKMRSLAGDWNTTKLNTEIDAFIANLRKFGGKAMLQQTIEFLTHIRSNGKAKMLIDCLNGLISVDDNIDERELILCSRFAKLLSR